MQEAAPKDPLNAVSFDNGLGIMQITPYKGKLDPDVAKAIGWDNNKSVAENKKTSNWRNAKANLRAGAFTMLGKAKAIKRGVPTTWEKMDEPHKWRAVLYAYNAGEGSALSALKRGGPNASMISTFTNPKGVRVSHDYTKEIKEKMDYVDSHDPFDGDAGGAGEQEAKETKPDTADGGGGNSTARPLKASVGRGGENRKADVGAVQERLAERGLDPGKVDQLMGPKTIAAIEAFQQATIGMADGLITPGKNTEKNLFNESGKVRDQKPEKDESKDAKPDQEQKDDAKEERESLLHLDDGRKVKVGKIGLTYEGVVAKLKKGQLWLISARQDTVIPLNRLHPVIGSARLSFGSAERLMKYLGVLPGAVTPLSAINDTQGRVAICLDRAILQGDAVHCHPLVNTMTTTLQPDDLLRFLRETGHEPRLIDIPERSEA